MASQAGNTKVNNTHSNGTQLVRQKESNMVPNFYRDQANS